MRQTKLGRPLRCVMRGAALLMAMGWLAALSRAPDTYFVLFGLGEAELDEGDQQIVEQVIKDLAANLAAGTGGYQMSVTGHSDTSGPEDYNKKLSWRRAEIVRDALIAGGIDPNAITIAARGEIELMVPTPDGIKEQGNRRAEIVVAP